MSSEEFSFVKKRILEEFSKPIHKGIGDLALELGMKDNTTLLYHIRKLVNAGFLIRPKKGNYKTVLQSNSENSNILQIPYYGEARCGDGGNFLDDNPEYHIPMNTQLVKRNSKNLFALKAVGDSMEPEIYEGDTVIVEKQDNQNLEKNGLYVVNNDQQTLIKKILPLEKGVLLMSTNSKHQPITTNQGKLNVVGRVVGVYKSF